jgi:hypothetical protein
MKNHFVADGRARLLRGQKKLSPETIQKKFSNKLSTATSVQKQKNQEKMAEELSRQKNHEPSRHSLW